VRRGLQTAVYPGSFDPITLGHVDIIERVSRQFDQVVVLVAESKKKVYLFDIEERKALVRACLEHVPNVRVESYQGLTVNFAKTSGAHVLVRGLRTVSDFDSEMAMAEVNNKLGPGLETFLIFARPEYRCISSQLVKEVALLGGDLQGLLPRPAEMKLKEKIWNSQPVPKP
jgi:pantetheine-phosphate adenylyltransferase